MRIKTLILQDFGKFHDYTLHLEDKLNIIMGENEAGKSTIYSFITGMFFGFFKPGVTRKYYMKEYDMYKPWKGKDYRGTIIFYDETMKQNIRVERNFLKTNEKVTVFIEETGEDITSSYEVHPVYKLPDIGKKHLGISYSTFRNTIGVRQANVDFTKEIDAVVANKLGEITPVSGTMSQEFSVERLAKSIEQELKEIGNMRSQTSKYYQLHKKIEKLKEEEQEAKDALTEIGSIQNEGKKAKEELVHKKKLVEEIKKKNYSKQIYMQITRIGTYIKTLENIQEAIDELAYKKLFEDRELQQFYQLFVEKEKLQEENIRLSMLLENAHKEQKKVMEELEEEKKEYKEKWETAKKAVKEEEKKKEQHENVKKMTVGFAIIIGIMGIMMLVLQLPLIAGVFGFGFLFFMVIWLLQRKKEEACKHKVEEETIVFEELTKLCREKEEQIKKAKDIPREVVEYNHRIMVIMEEKDKIEEKLQQLFTAYPDIQQERKEIQALIEKQSKYNENIQQYKSNLNTINALIQTIEETKGETKGKRKEETKENQDVFIWYKSKRQELLYEDREELPELEDVKEEVLKLEKQIASLNEGEKRILDSIRTISEIQEEREEDEKTFEEYKRKIKILKTVKEGFEAVLDDMRHEFAPILNEAVSDLTAKVTEKYVDIKVTSDMEMRMVDPESGNYIHIDDVSFGTKDLLTIALRRALAKWLQKKERLPLIFDEAFAYVDDKRVEKMLVYLENVEEQVILFTCQQREIRSIAQNIQLKSYNYMI